MVGPDDDLLQELLSTFRDEAADHLQTINKALLCMERAENENERVQHLQEAFRAAHSLKGAARAVNLADIEALAHSMEGVLQVARDSGVAPNPNTCDTLYQTLDQVEGLLSEHLGDEVGAQEYETAADYESPMQATEPAALPGTNGETIRVALDKIDDLMAQVAELLVAKIAAEQRTTDARALSHHLVQWPPAWREISALLPHINDQAGRQLVDALNRHAEYMQTLTERFTAFDQSLRHDTMQLNTVTTDLQDRVRRVRMVPFQTMTLALERAVRDVARSENKQVDFVIEGGEVELDKHVLETLKDPLLHLLRNAIDHGIENPKARKAARKSPVGRVHLHVSQRGSEVDITVRDDGQGFDLEALAVAFKRHNGSTPDGHASADDLVGLAFMPGVTTAPAVTTISGRGVGLDVVRQRIAAIQGRIAVDNVPGQGVEIKLTVPTSLAMTRGLLVRAGTQRYALPLLSVEKIIVPRPQDTFMVGGRHMLKVDDVPLPVVSLTSVLQMADNAQTPHLLVVVLAVADQRLALLVDDVLTEQELAVKPLGKLLQRVRNVTGAALLGNGEPVIVLNPADLLKSAQNTPRMLAPITAEAIDDTVVAHHTILVVDDSITTRTLEKNILETAGYTVITATDGREAVKRLHDHAIDIIVSDIQMPHMDGFTLTRHLREDVNYSGMPIVLVTSLESPEDREHGLTAGADAYIVKRGFDQAELLKTIERLL